MSVGKVVRQEEDINAQVCPSTSEACMQVCKRVQTKGLVSRVTCKLIEFPSIWKHANVRTQQNYTKNNLKTAFLRPALSKCPGSVQCGSLQWVFPKDRNAAIFLKQLGFSVRIGQSSPCLFHEL